MRYAMNYLYIFGTIFFTVYGQLILKWQVSQAGPFPVDTPGKIGFILRLLLNPWVMSGIVGGFLAFLCWMAAMTKFELSYAYPFMSLSFLLVLIFSYLLFKEPLTTGKVTGVMLIIIGLYFSSR